MGSRLSEASDRAYADVLEGLHVALIGGEVIRVVSVTGNDALGCDRNAEVLGDVVSIDELGLRDARVVERA